MRVERGPYRIPLAATKCVKYPFDNSAQKFVYISNDNHAGMGSTRTFIGGWGTGGLGGGLLFLSPMLQGVPHRQIILDHICQVLGAFLANWIVP